VPLLGPDLAEHVYGSVRSLASGLAATNGYPFTPADRSDLARVAQYIAAKSSIEVARVQIRTSLLTNLVQRTRERGVKVDVNGGPLAILQAAADRAAKDPQDPLCILANLGTKFFVNAASDPLFEMGSREWVSHAKLRFPMCSNGVMNGAPIQPWIRAILPSINPSSITSTARSCRKKPGF
jgi:hypothetical protein